MKNKIIAGNWKMNKTIKETELFFEVFTKDFNTKTKNKVIICPSFLSIQKAVELVKDLPIAIGAQNMHYSEPTIYTGEVNAEMLTEVGVKYAIIGHSSRRENDNDNNERINKKLHACIDANITPILCVGENKKERDMGRTYKVIKKQLTEAFDDIEEPSKVIVAYEPIWAISDGKAPVDPPTMEEISSVVSGIRRVLKQLYEKDAVKGVNVLYGGSVTEKNALEIMSIKNVNGVLVGGASLKPEKFNGIIKAVD